LLVLILALAAVAASLPGIPIAFDDAGWRVATTYTIPGDVPSAGPKEDAHVILAGWTLTGLDGRKFESSAARRIADGPPRAIELSFTDPKGAVHDRVVVRRELVRAVVAGTIPFPDGFTQPVKRWSRLDAQTAVLFDASDHGWTFDAKGTALVPVQVEGELGDAPLSPILWRLSEAAWVVDRAGGYEMGDAAWAATRFANAARLDKYGGTSGDLLALPGEGHMDVYRILWPVGTPALPTCSRLVPETCLVSGRAALADLGDREGVKELATAHFAVACSAGVLRACFEKQALGSDSLAPRARACADGDFGACGEVSSGRFSASADAPSDEVMGLLRYSCDIESNGSLGERLRSLREIGAGCMELVTAHDRRHEPDQALLVLDQACVIGRAEACDDAAARRHLAFAARIVRECEEKSNPVAESCVNLGTLLQSEKVESTQLDAFAAFLRACTLGNEQGCIELGDFVDRWGIDNTRVKEAEAQLQAACQAGASRACVGAGHLLVRHEPKTDQYGNALVLFAGACKDNESIGCVAGARQRRIGNAKKVEAPSRAELWQAACDQRNVDGCAGLGENLAGSKSTWGNAFTAWSRACEGGDAHSCTELADLVEHPRKTAWPDEKEPKAYWTEGCDGGDAEGCYDLARSDLPKRGEPSEASYLLLERACTGEYGVACADLGQVHLDRDTSFDDEIAARHLDTACENGHYESCRTLGYMYLNGKGVERDRRRAQELLDLFRQNAQRKYVRLGAQIGFPSLVAGSLELVLPTPVGPALSIAGEYSYVPIFGSVLVSLENDSQPSENPALVQRSLVGRFYPNHQARGLFVGASYGSLLTSGGSVNPPLVRNGYTVRGGLRNDSKIGYAGVEMGLAMYGVIDTNNFAEDGKNNHTPIPLIMPFFVLTVGLAPI
jgi:uncharacterized protein